MRQKKGSLVDCNAWFVDPEFSHANSQLNLSEILFFALCLDILRLGKDHFIGATNERYKASRWVAKVGSFPDNLTFKHPSVPDLHKLTLVGEFYPEWLKACWSKYVELIDNRFELTPASISRLKVEDVVAGFRGKPLLKAA